MRFNRNIAYIGIIAVLLVVTTIWLELRPHSPVDTLIQRLSQQIDADNLEQAKSTIDDLEKEWKRRRFWLALNNSIEDQQDFEQTLSQIKSFTRYGDRANAAAQTAVLHQIWLELGD